MSLPEWKASLASVAGKQYPRDLDHAVNTFPNAKRAFRLCLGFLLFYLELKFGPARIVFLETWEENSAMTNNRQRLFKAGQAVAKAMHEDPPDDWLDDVGASIQKAHGYQRALAGIHAIVKDARGKLVLGRERQHFRLGTWGVEAEEAVSLWENMHLSVASVFAYGAPETLREYDKAAKALSYGFKWCKVPGHTMGMSHYAVDWLIRSLLVPFMRFSNVMRLRVEPGDRMGILPGPDESKNRKTLAELAGGTLSYSVSVIFERLQYEDAPEVFCMWACLLGPLLQRPRKKRKTRGLDHNHFVHEGEDYMTLFQFKHWKKLTRNDLDAVTKLESYSYANKDTIVFTTADDLHYARQLPSAWYEDGVDLENQTVVQLKSKMTRSDKQKHAPKMHAYLVQSLEVVYSQAKKRRR